MAEIDGVLVLQNRYESKSQVISFENNISNKIDSKESIKMSSIH